MPLNSISLLVSEPVRSRSARQFKVLLSSPMMPVLLVYRMTG
jgi:hypothetical protein